jgi:hypothetical protein
MGQDTALLSLAGNEDRFAPVLGCSAQNPRSGCGSSCSGLQQLHGVQALERVGEVDWPCGNRGICSLTSGTCGCNLGYMGPDCGECARGFVRVDEHCEAFAQVYIAPRRHSLQWLWILLALLLLCCCCCCLAWARYRHRRDEAARYEARFVPDIRDLSLINVRSATATRSKVFDHSNFVRPDVLMKGNLARRASMDATPRPVSESARMCALTGGGNVWPLRRAATLDGACGSNMMEMYSDGRPRQRADCAYSESFSGASAHCASVRLIVLIPVLANEYVGGALPWPCPVLSQWALIQHCLGIARAGVRVSSVDMDDFCAEVSNVGQGPNKASDVANGDGLDVCVTSEPRSVLEDGLLFAENRHAVDDFVAACSTVSNLELAKEHLHNLENDTYLMQERHAARCATLIARQGNKEADDCDKESMLSVLLRRRVRFKAIPVVGANDSYEAIETHSNKQPHAIMMTMMSEDMHRRLAMQSREDAVAYLEMLNQHDGLTLNAQVPQVPCQLGMKENSQSIPSEEGSILVPSCMLPTYPLDR